MKHNATLLLLIATIFLHTNAQAYSQGITLKVSDATLDKVFSLIQKQTKFVFIYSGKQLTGTKRVSVDVTNEKFENVMKMVMDGQPLRYELDKEYVIIKVKMPNVVESGDGKPGELTGRVTNEKGEPVAGATVTVKNSNINAATDLEGYFTLKGVDTKAELVITSIGYEPKIVRLTGEEKIAIKMIVSAQTIKEVIVSTGYQNVSKERFVGSYSQLDSASFHRRAGMGIIDRLDGTVTGTLFTYNKDGSVAPLQIRGISTLAGVNGAPSSAPLIILNNFPYTDDISTINPNDVESVTILKDAAAASIWGSRAGNGVIVINTKKGKYNQPFKVSISSNVSIHDKPDPFYYKQIESSEFIELEKYLFSQGYYASLLGNTNLEPVTPIVEILDKLDKNLITPADAEEQINALKQYDLRNDLDKYVFRRSITQQHYLNLSGGVNTMRYMVSIGYNNSMKNIQGAKPNEAITINSNISFRPIKRLEIRTGIILGQGTIRPISNSIPFQYPYERLVDDKGKAVATPHSVRLGYVDTVGSGQLLDWHYRPLDEIRLADDKEITRSVLVNLDVSYNLTDWLTLQLSSQFNVQSASGRNFRSKETYYTRDLVNRFTNVYQTDPHLRNPVPVGGILDLSNRQSSGQSLRGQILINKNWSIHSVNAMLSTDISESNGNSNLQRFYGYDDQNGTYFETIDYFNQYPLYGDQGDYGFVQNGNRISEKSISRMVSLAGNASYTYASRYTLYGSARRDGSNLFGVRTNDKWKPLWSVGVAWNLTKESFFNVKWIGNLALRSSYGYSGNVNNQLSAYTTIQYLSPANVTNLTRAELLAPPNPDLRWEQVRTLNLGMDFSILNNRISGSVEVFKKKSTDLIAPLSFAPSHGVNSFPVNYASLKGNGFEVSLNTRNTIRTIDWRTSIGVSYARTIVTNLYQPVLKASYFIGYGLHPAVGQIAYGISSYKWAGLDSESGDPQGFLNGKPSKDYVAIFNDSVGNQIFHGSSIPLYHGFMKNSFQWKRFALSANIVFKFAYYFRNPTFGLSQIPVGYAHVDYLSRWQKPGDEKITNIPSLRYPIPPEVSLREEFFTNSEINILRGDNVRLQDIHLQYNFPISGRLKNIFKSLDLFLYANNLNLILWRKNKSGIDPDFATTVIGASFTGPTPRSFTAGLNISF